jgi:hypothetical protein
MSVTNLPKLGGWQWRFIISHESGNWAAPLRLSRHGCFLTLRTHFWKILSQQTVCLPYSLLLEFVLSNCWVFTSPSYFVLSPWCTVGNFYKSVFQLFLSLRLCLTCCWNHSVRFSLQWLFSISGSSIWIIFGSLILFISVLFLLVFQCFELCL